MGQLRDVYRQSSLVWVRGGKWDVREAEASLHRSEDHRARLKKPRLRRRNRKSPPEVVDVCRRAHKRRLGAESAVVTRPRDWQRLWGKPLGLERYEVTESARKAALACAADYWEATADLTIDEFFDPATGEIDRLIEGLLIDFLERFGPLSRFRGVTQLSGRHPRRVDLIDMDEDLSPLGQCFAAIDGRTKMSTKELKEFVRVESRAAIRDITSVIAEDPRSGEPMVVGYPATLGCALWLDLSYSAQGSEPLCLYCRRPVERTGRPGHPFEYCLTHRSSKYRKRVARALAAQPYR